MTFQIAYILFGVGVLSLVLSIMGGIERVIRKRQGWCVTGPVWLKPNRRIK